MYVDYEYYLEHGGKMPREDFEAMENKSEAYIRYLTYLNGDVFAKENDLIKQAVCAVADIYHVASQNISSGQIKSENNDGYAVTYVTEQKDGQSKEDMIRKKAYDAAYIYLLPSGWLSRKVRCHHDYECGCDCL